MSSTEERELLPVDSVGRCPGASPYSTNSNKLIIITIITIITACACIGPNPGYVALSKDEVNEHINSISKNW